MNKVVPKGPMSIVNRASPECAWRPCQRTVTAKSSLDTCRRGRPVWRCRHAEREPGAMSGDLRREMATVMPRRCDLLRRRPRSAASPVGPCWTAPAPKRRRTAHLARPRSRWQRKCRQPAGHRGMDPIRLARHGKASRLPITVCMMVVCQHDTTKIARSKLGPKVPAITWVDTGFHPIQMGGRMSGVRFLELRSSSTAQGGLTELWALCDA